MHSNTADVSADSDWYMVLLAVIAMQSAVFEGQQHSLYDYLQMKSILELRCIYSINGQFDLCS